jgi:hypothetical protein
MEAPGVSDLLHTATSRAESAGERPRSVNVVSTRAILELLLTSWASWRGPVGCSSYDRPCESPANTLLPSRCWQSIQKLQTRAPFDAHHFDNDQGSASESLRCMAESAQIECGCNASPSSCCYWSSMPSPTPFTEDFIEYATRDNCLVQRVQVVPYRAFRLPGSPAFAAERVSFHLFRREGRDVVPVYCSPLYAMKNDMTLQEFELPRSVLLSRGGLIRVNLFGRYQRETIQLPPWIHQDEHYLHHNLLHYHNPEDPADPTESPQYYICLSYVNAVGVSNAL